MRRFIFLIVLSVELALCAAGILVIAGNVPSARASMYDDCISGCPRTAYPSTHPIVWVCPDAPGTFYTANPGRTGCFKTRL